jgi:hypothetical protein
MPRYQNADGPYEGGPANELELELHLQRVTLRDFGYELLPLAAGPPWNMNGLELVATARDTGLRVSLRFDRSEFVNIATAGLAMLDQADEATETQEGGE